MVGPEMQRLVSNCFLRSILPMCMVFQILPFNHGFGFDKKNERDDLKAVRSQFFQNNERASNHYLTQTKTCADIFF